MEAFGWSFVFPNSIFDILTSLLVGHHFGGTRRVIWLPIMQSFIWTLWGECNGQLFRDTSSTFDRFLDSVLTHIFNWYNLESPFNSYNLSFVFFFFFFFPIVEISCNHL